MTPKKSSNKAPAKSAPAAKATSAAQPAKKAATTGAPQADGDEDGLPTDVLEFIRAIDHFKRDRQRPFPSWSEVLDVLKGLGYERRAG
ncbi:MAG: hypothetical protein R3F49_19920 [Planctomycetota bacterium]